MAMSPVGIYPNRASLLSRHLKRSQSSQNIKRISGLAAAPAPSFLPCEGIFLAVKTQKWTEKPLYIFLSMPVPFQLRRTIPTATSKQSSFG